MRACSARAQLLLSRKETDMLRREVDDLRNQLVSARAEPRPYSAPSCRRMDGLDAAAISRDSQTRAHAHTSHTFALTSGAQNNRPAPVKLDDSKYQQRERELLQR
jgi:hypothetical protein